MGVISFIKSLFVVHMLFGYIFVVSGLIVNFLQLCSMIIYPFHKHLYRKINVNLVYSHWSLLTFLAQWWSGSNVILHCTDEDMNMLGKEHVLVIMNHKYDVDWMMAWIIAERRGMLGGTKIYGKQMLKYVPLIGWAWYFSESIFLKRQWDQDRVTLKTDLKKITDYPDDYWVTLLLFPEGTRFTVEKHKLSLEITKQKGYQEMKHHLLPRSKGFTMSVHGFKDKIPTILDLTVGFERNSTEPTLLNILSGKPLSSRIEIKRYKMNDVPTDSDASTANWLRELFYRKDASFEYFLEHDRFEAKEQHVPWRFLDLFMFIFWSLLTCVPLFYYVGVLFMSGSIYQQGIFMVVVLLVSVGVRWMIGVTEIHKGSSYGKKDS